MLTVKVAKMPVVVDAVSKILSKRLRVKLSRAWFVKTM